MGEMLSCLTLLGGVLLGGVIVWAWTRQELAQLKIALAELRKEKEAADEKLCWVERGGG
jgi:hypothetical protein